MKLSIIQLNYRNTDMVIQNIQTLLKHPPNCEYEVLLIDNASGDGSAARLQAAFPDLRVIENPRNGGFAYGNNVGIRETTGECIFIMNPDISVKSGDVQAMVDFMDTHADVGLAGPKLVNRDGSLQYSCTRWPHFAIPVYRRTLLGKIPCGRRAVEHYLMLDWDHHKPRTVNALFGASLFVRRKALEDVGWLDEHFFMYVEDIDWSRRFWKAGWKVAYAAHVEFSHYHTRESAKRTLLQSLFSKLAFVHMQSWLYYFKKYRGQQNPKRTELESVGDQQYS